MGLDAVRLSITNLGQVALTQTLLQRPCEMTWRFGTSNSDGRWHQEKPERTDRAWPKSGNRWAFPTTMSRSQWPQWPVHLLWLNIREHPWATVSNNSATTSKFKRKWSSELAAPSVACAAEWCFELPGPSARRRSLLPEAVDAVDAMSVQLPCRCICCAVVQLSFDDLVFDHQRSIQSRCPTSGIGRCQVDQVDQVDQVTLRNTDVGQVLLMTIHESWLQIQVRDPQFAAQTCKAHQN